MRICNIEPRQGLKLILMPRPLSEFFAIGSIAVFFLTLVMIATPVFAATTAPQFASYSITGTGHGRSFTAIVNESVSPSSNSGFSDVVLSIASADGNLSYSKIINSSQVILPYFPTIANQSLTYQMHNYSISATIDQAGIGSVNFDGKTVTVSNFTFSLNVSGNRSVSATGTATVFPSGLVYSAVVVANGTDTLNVQLLATNLSLTSQSDPSSQISTSVAIAGSAASILVGLGAIVVYRRRNNSQANTAGETKPLYHVD